MNWHITFFIFDIIGWLTISTLICSNLIIKKSRNFNNLSNITRLNIIIVTFFVGLFSVLIKGLPDTGFATYSFIYTFFASLGLVVLLRTKIKRIITKNTKITEEETLTKAF